MTIKKLLELGKKRKKTGLIVHGFRMTSKLGLAVVQTEIPSFITSQFFIIFSLSSPLPRLLSDIDGLGSSAIGGQLIRRPSSQLSFSCDKPGSDATMAGL